MTSRWLRIGGTALACSLTLALPAFGQKTTFNPHIAVDEGYTDDVNYAGAGKSSDTTTRLSVLLPVVRTWERGALDFSYEPSIERYSDADALDNDSHVVLFGVRSTLSRKSDLTFTTGYTRSQSQGRAASLDEADLFLTERTERELLRADLGYAQRIAARWNWSGTLSFGDSQFEPIDGVTPSAIEVEDRTDYGASVQFGRSLSPQTTLGFGYGWRRFDLEEGEETVQSVFLAADRKVTRKMELGFRVGGFRSDDRSLEADGDSRSGAEGSLRLKRSYRSFDLALDASHSPSSGGALAGTSSDSSIGLGLNSSAQRSWLWSASTRLARRDPTDPQEQEVTSAALGGSIERSFARVLGVRLGGNYVDQSSDAPELEAEYYTAALGIVWYPLGRTAVAGGATP